MRIEQIRTSEANGRARVCAAVVWEDSDRPAQEIYFETPTTFAEALTTDHDAFVLGAVMPAYWHNERRLAVAGSLCPVLHDGLRVAMALLREWRGLARPPLIVEGTPRTVVSRTPDRAGSFFSGGIDALATLRGNRLHYPRDHPASIRDGIIVYGLEVEQPEAFEKVLDNLAPIARDADVTLIPVYTNVRALEPSWIFWHEVSLGSICAAIAHALKRRLTLAYLGSSADIPHLDPPTGTHPLLDSNYTSGDLTFRHDGIALSRLSKARLVADWPIALDHLRVCNKVGAYRRGALNCGRCEKCVRTQLALLCAGALDRTSAFQSVDLSEAAVGAAIFSESAYRSYQELIEPLRAIGRGDLARLAARKVARSRGRDWRVHLARIDSRYLGGNLSRIKRALS